MAQITIYGLHRPGRDVFYIGKTNNLKRRLKEHRRFLKGQIDAVVLEVVDAREWRYAEHRWIQHYRDKGVTIANKTEGGDGTEVMSQETIEKLRAIRTGWTHTPEELAKMSAATKGKPKNWSAEGRERVRSTQIKPGTKPWNAFTPDMTEEQKEAIRQHILANRTEASIERMRQGAQKANEAWLNYTPEEKAARAAAVRAGQFRVPPEERSANARRGAEATSRKWAEIRGDPVD